MFWISDLALLWLWHRLAAIVPIGRLAWELPYTTGVALRDRKTKRKVKFKKVISHSWNVKAVICLNLVAGCESPAGSLCSFLSIWYKVIFCILSFLRLLSRHMLIPRLGVKSEL